MSTWQVYGNLKMASPTNSKSDPKPYCNKSFTELENIKTNTPTAEQFSTNATFCNTHALQRDQTLHTTFQGRQMFIFFLDLIVINKLSQMPMSSCYMW